MKKLKMFLCIALLLPVIYRFPVTAAGDLGEYNPNVDCSLKITLAEGVNKDNFVEGAEVTIYQVADASVQNGEYVYQYREAFAECGIAIPDQMDIKYARQLKKYVADNGIDGVSKVSDNAGAVSFTDLEAGLYLVAQTGSVEGYTDFEPFMAYLPTAGEDQWHYDVEAQPKIGTKGDDEGPGDDPKVDTSYVTVINVRKVWNDNGKGRPESITVELLNGTDVYDRVVLSESNGWKFTWNAIGYSNNWSIREVDVPQGYTVTYSREGMSFVINNTQNLIQTGQLQWPIPVLACLGLLLITAGIFFKCRWKEPQS